MTPLHFARTALMDLESIRDYISRDSTAEAQRWVETIIRTCQRIRRHPQLGRPREELAPGLRSLLVGRYYVYDRIEPRRIAIVRVLSGYREIGAVWSDDSESDQESKR